MLLGITHAETVDQIFPNWFNEAFVRGRDDTNYRPYDLNMPTYLLRLIDL